MLTQIGLVFPAQTFGGTLGQSGSLLTRVRKGPPVFHLRTFSYPQDSRPHIFLIGCIGVSGKTKWDVLDGVVRRLFKVSVSRREAAMAVCLERGLGLGREGWFVP